MKIEVRKFTGSPYKFISIYGTIYELRTLLSTINYRTNNYAGDFPSVFHFYCGKNEYNFVIHNA